MEGQGEIKNLMRVCFLIFTSLIYCYFISCKIPKGKFRLFSLLPIIFLFTLLPFLFSYLFPRAISPLFIWLANSKLLLFAFDQGPLSCHPLNNNKSLIQFIIMAILPTKIKENRNYAFYQIRNPSQLHQNSPSKSPKIPLNWPIKVFLFTIFVSVYDYIYQMHQNLILVLYCCMVYLLVDIVFGTFNGLMYAILQMELESPSDEPYISTSLQDFWGRRWNLMVSNSLSHTVYKPVRLCLDALLGEWAPLAAILATFLVSGLIHELLFYNVTRASPTWEITCFFVLHGVCLVVELSLKRLFSDSRWQLHWAVSGSLTVGFVMVTAMWLFFPPLIRTGATDDAIHECKMMLNYVKGIIKMV